LKHDLLKTQKNDVLLLIKEAGLDPTAFEWGWGDLMGGSAFAPQRVICKGTDYYFQFNFDIRVYEWSPGDGTPSEINRLSSWDEVLDSVRDWTILLRKELEAPDLWALASSDTSILDDSSGQDMEGKFTAGEHSRLIESLDEIKQFLLATHEFDSKKLDFIERRMKYLLDASDRVTKKDWLLLTFATLIQIATTIGLEPAYARELIEKAGIVLRWIGEHAHKLIR